MEFKRQAAIGILGLAVLVATCGSAWAKNSGHVSLSQAVTIGSTQLAAGEYHVSWQTHSPEATVTFTGKHRAQATADGKLVERATRYNNDSVVYADNPDGTKTILEIRFADSNKVLTFGEAAPTSEAAAPKQKKVSSSTATGSAPQRLNGRLATGDNRLMLNEYMLEQAARQSQQSYTPTSGRQPIKQ